MPPGKKSKASPGTTKGNPTLFSFFKKKPEGDSSKPKAAFATVSKPKAARATASENSKATTTKVTACAAKTNASGKGTAATNVTGTPKGKIHDDDPKTPSTDISTDAEEDISPILCKKTAKAADKPFDGSKKKQSLPSNTSGSNNPAKQCSASTRSSATKKRRFIEEDSDEEEMEWNDVDEERQEGEKHEAKDAEQENVDEIPIEAAKQHKEDNNMEVETERKPPAKKSTSNSNGSNETNGEGNREDPYQKKNEPAKEIPAAVAAAKKPSSWGFLGNAFAASNKKKRKNASSSKTADGGANTGRSVIKNPYTAGDDLPILSNPQDMFDDMVHNQLCDYGTRVDMLRPLLETLHGRTLKIATMCSGTESPVLALDMISKSIEDVCKKYNITVGANKDEVPQIVCEHIFSCEIEPFKQSYIERNFQPKRLFRDIRELGNDKACTAFGALIDVPNTPGCVDILVAGTSCVDYSNLNNKKKAMEDLGESGQTFQGMMNWVKKAQPAMVIIENVRGAPWDAKVKLMESLGYAAVWMHVDSKDFYIPRELLETCWVWDIRSMISHLTLSLCNHDTITMIIRNASAWLSLCCLEGPESFYQSEAPQWMEGKNGKA
jgi:C-5 cytosine-specific DNA methylase